MDNFCTFVVRIKHYIWIAIVEGKNYIFHSFLIVFIIALIFGSLSVVDTEQKLLGYSLKPIHMFSDVLPDVVEPIDSTLAQAVIIPAVEKPDTCPEGMVCIQNFTSETHPLDPLFGKLQHSRRGSEKVRIAWFGDSFTDADLVVCDLRDSLQSVFGGNGVGFVPITHEAAGYRRSVMHSFGGWISSSVVSRKGNANFGINGFNYRPDSANYVRFAATRKFKHTRKFDIFRLFYASSVQTQARIALNDTIHQQLTLSPTNGPEMLAISQRGSRRVKLNFSEQPGTVIYGASLEDSTGIYVDNFSIKGNSGLSLLSIPTRNLRMFDSLLNYDLIVLQFGLNAITPESRKYSSYMQGMERVIKKFKTAFPNTPILMLSVSDRSERLNGEFVTMKAVKSLVAVQERFAYDHKLLFWNLYEAMGGENSMKHFVESNPSLASKDYTHLNFDGGRIIGHKLARSFLFEDQKFTERRKNLVAN